MSVGGIGGTEGLEFSPKEQFGLSAAPAKPEGSFQVAAADRVITPSMMLREGQDKLPAFGRDREANAALIGLKLGVPKP